ncbi:MAG TPA: phage portal protein [Azospirillaceae bacterium]|nr:phage portal protein [Azospirillaceae bacterium]
MFQKLKSLWERKSASADDPWAALLGAATPTAAGIQVGPEAAMRCSPAFACIRIIAETVEQVPLHLYRRTQDGGRERVTEHPAAKVLRQPNEWTTSAEFKLLLGTHLATFGNAYAWVGRDGDGNALEAIPLDPRRVSIKADALTMQPVYTVTAGNGTQRTYSRADVLHVRGPGLDVYKGAAPVELAREAIGLALTLEAHCAGLFGRGAKPAGMLKVKGRKTEEALKRIRALFSAFYSGAGNAGKTMILDEDMDFTQVQLNSVDTQTLEMRRHQIAEVSRFWRIPLSLLNDLERVTHANAEALGQQFLTFCMLPIFRSITDALALTLLKPEERDEFYFEFLVDDIARADLAARFLAYSRGIMYGFMSPNEVRAAENRPPYEGGERFRMPLNVADAEAGSTSTEGAGHGS